MPWKAPLRDALGQERRIELHGSGNADVPGQSAVRLATLYPCELGDADTGRVGKRFLGKSRRARSALMFRPTCRSTTRASLDSVVLEAYCTARIGYRSLMVASRLGLIAEQLR